MLALASVITFACTIAASTVAQPVAVAPWKNLNDDASLRWLEQGAAETMAADLKRAGVDVVERTQIAEALAQVGAQQRDDVARAVAAGRIVGAKSIVLGAFQKSGAKVRLTSRVVDVETGRVQDAATATGAIDDIFALQDEIVRGLTGAAPPKRARTARPVAKAYEKFATALTTTAPVEQRALLEESLRLDPELVYAKDALAALEARLRDGARASTVAFDARAKELLAVVDDATAPAERRRASARALLAELESSRRFRALRAAAERVLAAQLPRDVVEDLDEHASYARVLSHARLVENDLALQAGERHLQSFATGAHRGDVDKLVRDVVERQRSVDARRREYDEELADAERPGTEHGDWRRCIAAKWSKLPQEMITNCQAFLARWPKSEHVPAGRAFVAWGRALGGEMAQARAAADALERDLPGSLDETGLRAVMATWSAD